MTYISSSLQHTFDDITGVQNQNVMTNLKTAAEQNSGGGIIQ
jgi:hypothetical protein